MTKNAGTAPSTPRKYEIKSLEAGCAVSIRPGQESYGLGESISPIPKSENESMQSFLPHRSFGSPANNPRVPDKAEIMALYREVWTGAPRNA